VDHDDDVGAGGQGFAIAGLLVASVAVVAVVDEILETEFLRHFHGAVFAVVVDEDAGVDDFGQLADGLLKSFLRVVGGEDDRDALGVDHGRDAAVEMITEAIADCRSKIAEVRTDMATNGLVVRASSRGMEVRGRWSPVVNYFNCTPGRFNYGSYVV